MQELPQEIQLQTHGHVSVEQQIQESSVAIVENRHQQQNGHVSAELQTKVTSVVTAENQEHNIYSWQYIATSWKVGRILVYSCILFSCVIESSR